MIADEKITQFSDYPVYSFSAGDVHFYDADYLGYPFGNPPVYYQSHDPPDTEIQTNLESFLLLFYQPWGIPEMVAE